MNAWGIIQRFLLCVGIIAFVLACSSTKQVQQQNVEVNTPVEDSTEYDVEMFDGKFEVWYERYKSPASYQHQSYYESWNKQYVSAWNKKVNSSAGSFPFDPVVGFNPNEDYGFELNHKLFHYFMYVENVLGIKILQGGPSFTLKSP